MIGNQSISFLISIYRLLKSLRRFLDGYEPHPSSSLSVLSLVFIFVSAISSLVFIFVSAVSPTHRTHFSFPVTKILLPEEEHAIKNTITTTRSSSIAQIIQNAQKSIVF